MKKKLWFVLLVCAMAVSFAQAQNVYQWFGTDTEVPRPAPTTAWLTGYAWMTEIGPDPTGHYGTLPDAFAKAKINNVQWGGVNGNWDQWSPVVSTAVTIGDVFIAEAGAMYSPEHLTVAVGGNLTVQGATSAMGDGQINIGYQAGAVGSLIVKGIVTIDGPIHVGWGGSGHLQLDSGTLNAQSLDINGSLGTGSGTIDITGGELFVAGNRIADFELFRDSGFLTGYGSEDNVMMEYKSGRTHVWAIPEPISISLLGLGALALLRKRS